MAAESLVEEVALNLEEAAEVTRRINPVGVKYFLGGLAVGAVVGFYIGYRLRQAKLREEAYTEAEKDVAKIKEYYSSKLIAAEGQEAKKNLVDIIEERGYSTHTDREGPTTVLTDEQMRPLPAPVPIIEAPREVPLEELIVAEEDKAVLDVWNFPKELESRNPEHPYVIHQSELGETRYDHVTYTYYELDDVLCDEDDTPLTHSDIVVGQNNLKWGHGSDDIDVVFVRNDKLELDMEICRSHKSYEEEVLGHEHDEAN